MKALFKIPGFLLMLSFLLLPVTGFGSKYDIKQISTLEGLSQNSITTVCVDDFGYMWIGTAWGLNRYDGSSIKKYFYNDKDSTSISGNTIRYLYQSEDGNLWIITDQGVCRYDYPDNTFDRFYGGASFGKNSKIHEDPNKIWIFSSENQIFTIDKSTSDIKEISIHSEYSLAGIRDVEKKGDRFFILTETDSIFTLNRHDLDLQYFNSVEGKDFMDIELVKDDIFIVSRWNIIKLQKNGKKEKCTPVLGDGLQSPIFLGLKYNKWENNYWVYTDGNGILIFDLEFNLIKTIKETSNVNGIMPDNSIRELLIPDNKICILGTVRSGIVILNESQFRKYEFQLDWDKSTQTKSVNDLTEDIYGNVWIGTDGGGLKCFNPDEESFLSYVHPNISKITGIANYSNRYILVASYFNGLYVFDKREKTFLPSKQHPHLESISANGLVRLFEDSQNNIWIASHDNLYLINQNSQKILNPIKDSELTGPLKNPFPYYSIYETSKREIWFSSVYGLICYSLDQNKFIHQIRLNENTRTTGSIKGFAENKEGNIFFSTENGLYKIDPKSLETSQYLSSNELKNRTLNSIYINSKNQIWAGTNNGIILIDKNDGNNDIIQFNSFGELGGSEFGRAVISKSDGLIFLGSNDGLIAFNPDDIHFEKKDSEVTITSLTGHENQKGNIISTSLASNIQDSLYFEIKFKPRSYNFKFSTLCALDEKHTQYAYTLENFEDVWHSGYFHEVSYPNLKPGDYVFKVKATNMHGIMSDHTTDLFLKVLPAWYQTWWFRSLIFLGILGISLFLWFDSLKRAKLKHLLIAKKREQTEMRRINQMRLNFFTNISHELKTPLTLILSPLEHLAKKNVSADEVMKLFPFLYRSAKRMDMLISQLLEFRKMEVAKLKLNLEKADIIRDVREIINYFKHQAEIEGIRLYMDSFFTSFYFVYDRDKFFKILFNLIDNALKHTSQGDKVCLKIDGNSDGGLMIKIEDSGSGIPPEKLNSIFNCFYQADWKGNGVGIGLDFAKKLLELHRGEISVDSIYGEGTTFSIFLPVLQENISDNGNQEASLVPPKNINIFTEKDDAEENTMTKPLILLVEDEWDLRKYLSIVLSTDYKVLEAKNGEEGIKIAIEKIPDLIITDIMMPVLDGYKMCRILKEDLRTSHIPILMLTAKSNIKDKLQGFDLAVDAFITKPFNNKLLLSQIKAVFRNRNILKRRFDTHPESYPKDISPGNKDKKFMEKAVGIVHANIGNPGFGVAEFVEEMGLARTLVYKKTKTITGKTINEFIQQIRIQRAAKLLRTSEDQITSIALSCGFAEQTYFSTVFKKQYNISPTEYRITSRKKSSVLKVS